MGNGGSRASNSLSNDNDNNNIDHPGDGFADKGKRREGVRCATGERKRGREGVGERAEAEGEGERGRQACVGAALGARCCIKL